MGSRQLVRRIQSCAVASVVVSWVKPGMHVERELLGFDSLSGCRTGHGRTAYKTLIARIRREDVCSSNQPQLDLGPDLCDDLSSYLQGRSRFCHQQLSLMRMQTDNAPMHCAADTRHLAHGTKPLPFPTNARTSPGRVR